MLHLFLNLNRTHAVNLKNDTNYWNCLQNEHQKVIRFIDNKIKSISAQFRKNGREKVKQNIQKISSLKIK